MLPDRMAAAGVCPSWLEGTRHKKFKLRVRSDGRGGVRRDWWGLGSSGAGLGGLFGRGVGDGCWTGGVCLGGGEGKGLEEGVAA